LQALYPAGPERVGGGGLDLYKYAPNPLNWFDLMGLIIVTVGRWMEASEYKQMLDS